MYILYITKWDNLGGKDLQDNFTRSRVCDDKMSHTL